MKASAGRKRGVWFWAGVVLLSFSALLWLILIVAIAVDPEDIGYAILGGVIFTAIPIGIGIYSVLRGIKLKAIQETGGRQMPTGKDTEILLRQREQITATNKVSQFNRLSWLVVIGFPILAIIVAVVFQVLNLSGWLLILTLLVAFIIFLFLLSLVSKYQSIYFKKSTSKDSLVDEKLKDKDERSTK